MVRVVGYYNKTPLLEFMYRKGQLLNLAAEKTSGHAVLAALQATVMKWGLLLEDFTVVQELAGPLGHYAFYLEVSNPQVILGNRENIGRTLEEFLGQANPRYLAGLEAKRLAHLELYLVQAGTFMALRQELVKRGASLNQVKVPRLVEDTTLINILKENSLEMLCS